jgi:membrane fusion protein (multidrug efflux system)
MTTIVELNPAEQEARDPKANQTPEDPGKKRMRIFVLLSVLFVLLAGGLIWWLTARNYESTDDAQVDGHMNPISARIAGTIQGVYVENNQTVRAGQPLVDLDPRDFDVSLAQAKADYDQAAAQTTAQRPNLPITLVGNVTQEATGNSEVTAAEAALENAQREYDSAVQTLRSAEATNARAQSDLRRYAQLLQEQVVSQADYDQYEATAKAQEANVDADKATVAAATKTIDQRKAQLSEQQGLLSQTLKNAAHQVAIQRATLESRQAAAESSAAKLDQAKLNLGYTHIVSPVNGIVAQRSAEVGGQVSVGQQLMMVVQVDDLWVTANFKEIQLRRMRIGQPVRIHVDTLAEDFDGFIEYMPAATGDRTSVLPPENATGNYVKVVQRLPVRVRFKPNQRDLDKLRPGMSVEPKVQLE